MKPSLLISFCFTIGLASAQVITTNLNTLNFGNVFSDSPDSIQLTITNQFTQPYVITGFKFFNVFGKPAFSTTSGAFNLAPQTSQTIWVKFSPRHNIQHTSTLLIENSSGQGPLAIQLTGQGKYANTYYNSTENLSGLPLRNALKIKISSPYTSLGYNAARDQMFMSIDNKAVNGQGATQNTLTCVYTNRTIVGYANRTAAQNAPNNFNTEHTFPQGFFSQAEPMRSDIYHLYPTDAQANNSRANFPFGIASNPLQQVAINTPSKLGANNQYEPQQSHKGFVARSMMYFVVRYQDSSSHFLPQESILRAWHDSFPPTPVEIARGNGIAALQQNRNPFIDFPQFHERINSLVGTADLPQALSVYVSDTAIEMSVNAPIINRYVPLVNNGNGVVTISNITLTENIFQLDTPNLSTVNLINGAAYTIRIKQDMSLPIPFYDTLQFTTNVPGKAVVKIPVSYSIVFGLRNETIFENPLIYPSPASQCIHLAGIASTTQVEIYNLQGKMCLTKEIGSDEPIDVNTLSSGVYMVRFTNSTAKPMKFVKQ